MFTFFIVILIFLVWCQPDGSLSESLENFILGEEFNSDFKLSRKHLEKLSIFFPNFVRPSLDEGDPASALMIVFYYDWDSLFDFKLKKELFRIQDFFGASRLILLGANMFFTRSLSNYFNIYTSPSILILSKGSGVVKYKGIRTADFLIPFLTRFLLNETELVPNFEELEFRDFLAHEEYVVYQIQHQEKEDDENGAEEDSFWEGVYDANYIDPFIQAAKYLRDVSFCRYVVDDDVMSHQKIFLHNSWTNETLNFHSVTNAYADDINVDELIDWVRLHAPILVHDLRRRTFQEFMGDKQNVVLLFYRYFQTRDSSMETFKEVARAEHHDFHFSYANINSYDDLARRLFSLSSNKPIMNHGLILMDWKEKVHIECMNCLLLQKGNKVKVDVNKTIRFLNRYRTMCMNYKEEPMINLYRVSKLSGLTMSVSQFQYIKNRIPEFMVYFLRKQCLHCEVFEKKVLQKSIYTLEKKKRNRPTNSMGKPLLFITVDCEVENCHRLDGIEVEFLPYLVYYINGSYHVYDRTVNHSDFLDWIHEIQSVIN